MKTYIIRYPDGRFDEVKGSSIAFNVSGSGFIYINGDKGYTAVVSAGAGVAVYEKGE